MRPEITPIIINEHGDETHESWITIAASKLSGQTRLFDSEVSHQHWIRVRVQRCTRKRNLKRDWIHASLQTLIEVDMSESQWGAFVSSFGSGNGVPATLTRLDGYPVSEAPEESRLALSHREVKDAAKEATERIQSDYDALLAAFEAKAGRKELRERITAIGRAVGHVPENMEFVAKSLTEHSENVVTKARADVEAMVLNATQNGHELEFQGVKLLGEGGD